MAHPTSSTSGSSSGHPTPTGPGALRANGTTTSPPRTGKVSFSFPTPKPSLDASLPARPIHLDSRAGPSASNGVYSQRFDSGGSSSRSTGRSNGVSSASPAESSRHASSSHTSRSGENGRRNHPSSPPRYFRHSSPPPSSSRHRSSASEHPHRSEAGYANEHSSFSTQRRRNGSPTGRNDSPVNGKEMQTSSYKQDLIRDDGHRGKISFSIPTSLPNGATRPRPPPQTTSAFDILNSRGHSFHSVESPGGTAPLPPEQRPPSPPPPPSHNSPPPPLEDRPPTPPPPLDTAPPPPPSPPLAESIPPPPSSPSPSPSPSTSPSPPPSTSRLARPLPPHLDPSHSNAPLPPSFHFRELPVRRRTPSDESDSDAGSEHEAKRQSSVEAPMSGPSSHRVSRQISPRPSSPPIRKDYVASPYKPPPSTQPRTDVGSYVVLHDPAIHGSKNGKEVRKRFDGMQGDERVEASDPRLDTKNPPRWREGRGTAKNRATWYELNYEWDENSTGPKPPPPPPAVLITGLNPLTTVDQISKHLQPYGRIREIDSKMDLRSGMQLGICWVKFDGPQSGRPGTAYDVAVQVVKVCDGQRIGLSGNEKIKVVLDGRGLRAEKAVKEEMAKRYPPKKPAPPLPKPPPPAAATPSSGGVTPRTPRIDYPTRPTPPGPVAVPFHSTLPARPRPPNVMFDSAGHNYSSLGRSLPIRAHPGTFPARPSGLPHRPAPATQNLASSFVDAPFAPHSRGRRFDDLRDSYSPRRSRSRSRSRSHPLSCSTCSPYSSDSEYDRPAYRSRRSPSPFERGKPRGRVVPIKDRREDGAAFERINKALTENGHAYVFIDANALPARSVSEDHLKDHFRAFKPAQVLGNQQGWYILFNDDATAQRAKILDNTLVQGHRLVINARTATTTRKPLNDEAASAPVLEAKPTGNWRFLTITKKNRPAPVPRRPSPVVKERNRRRKPSYSSVSSSSEDEKAGQRSRQLRSLSTSASLSEEQIRVAKPKRVVLRESPDSGDEASSAVHPADEAMPVVKDDADQDEPVKPTKKRPGKSKLAKGAKKARVASPVIDLVPPSAPVIAEIKLDGITPKPTKAGKPRKPAKTEVDRLIESGAVQDEEDAYWLGQALAAVHEGAEPDMSDDESELLDDKHPHFHTSGSWRAEGWKKIPQIVKSKYLPQRNRAVVSTDDASALTSGRTARVTGRRLAHDMETTRKTAAAATAESDLFAFNQLRIRKKQLRFARSAIEGYGLYAMETIQTGEMVCEYVGEICRSAVAEIREQRYLKQGIGSSYLFRVDADMICDATFRGSVSRLINHSCDPSASAKIISINGQSKIVIYAKRTLHPGEEILYDYKFPLESDPTLRVPCLCGAPTCRGWLN